MPNHNFLFLQLQHVFLICNFYDHIHDLNKTLILILQYSFLLVLFLLQLTFLFHHHFHFLIFQAFLNYYLFYSLMSLYYLPLFLNYLILLYTHLLNYYHSIFLDLMFFPLIFLFHQVFYQSQRDLQKLFISSKNLL